jgi:SPP1 gp7 family putative phage head morphogenesis protein
MSNDKQTLMSAVDNLWRNHKNDPNCFSSHDLRDLHALVQTTDWLFGESCRGQMAEERHGEKIRKAHALCGKLGKKWRDYEYAIKARNAIKDDSDGREGRTTTHYIWRTQGDGNVRPSHAANEGKIFAWDNPPPMGNPGEAFGCRCWAEPHEGEEGELQERSSQVVTFAMPDATSAWNDDDLKYHYFNGNGRDLSLGHIGLLQGVINYARTQVQKSGGSIFDRVARKIFAEARLNGEGSFKSAFGTNYDFSGFLFSFGDSTVEGDAQVNVVEKEEFLIITAGIYYTFWDEYKDPFDIYDVIPVDIESPWGSPYKIMDAWSAHLEAIIKKDSSQSKYPNGEFGDLY